MTPIDNPYHSFDCILNDITSFQFSSYQLRDFSNRFYFYDKCPKEYQPIITDKYNGKKSPFKYLI